MKDVDLGGTSEKGADALDDLSARMARRLEAMGASTEPPPPPPPPKARGEFTISNAAATNDAAAAALARMRRRQTGELEQLYAQDIERAIKAANSWMDAKLPKRARAELDAIEPYMTFTSEQGAGFHMLLAKVAEANGQAAQARRILQRVAKEAKSSSQRWQADQTLSRGSAAPPSSSPSAPSEISSLFRMPDSWS